MPDATPPFKPFCAPDGGDTHANMLAYLEWVAEGIWRIHELSRMNLAYVKATYEGAARASQQPARKGKAQHQAASPAPTYFPPREPGLHDVLYEMGRYAVGNRKAISNFLRGLIR